VNRGIAYYDQSELDKERADSTSAIQPDSKNTEAFTIVEIFCCAKGSWKQR
jgi:hypothetical protein